MPTEIIWMLVTIVVLGVILVLSGAALGPRSALLSTRMITEKLDKMYFFLGYVCGVELLLLGFFITYQVVARKLDWVQAPALT